MQKLPGILLLFTLKLSCVFAQQPVDNVNVLIGTTGAHPTEYGGMIPGVTLPFGMTQWSAMTRKNGIGTSVYHYKDNSISGFTGTHQPAIWMGDYGYVSIMPGVGSQIKTDFKSRAFPFTHTKETATPYYYSVEMNSPAGPVKAEIAATSRCAIMKFVYPANSNPYMLIEAIRSGKFTGFAQVLADSNEVIGYNPDRQSYIYGPPAPPNFKGYFVVKFNKPFSSFGVWTGQTVKPAVTSQSGGNVGAYCTFNLGNTDTLIVKIASSFVNHAQARINMAQEIPHWNFAKVRSDGKDTWNKQLKRIEISGGTKDQRSIFYTGMYHAHLYPREFSEYGKYYSAFDDKIHNGVSYNDYSLWDTFRAAHPLLLLTAPERVSDMITSLLQMYKEGGWMPIWPNPTETNMMISTHADAVIGDAYVKGIRGFDLPTAYAAMYKDAMTPPTNDMNTWWGPGDPWTGYEARGGLTYYKANGYVPADKTSESASRTLEYAVDDYSVAQIAKAIGNTNDYNLFMKRTQNYKNVFNKSTGLMQAKNLNGSWANGGFTEGNQWEYTFCAMQDMPGLVTLMGGNTKFAATLDQNFASHYNHTNEPGHHYAYLYNYCCQPWKTQAQVRKICASDYHNTPDGLSGNEDCGQMSAWYLFSAMGFYPVSPGIDVYAIGSPLFDTVKIHLDAPWPKKDFTVIAKNVSATNQYIQSATLDGKPLDVPFLQHADILGGKTLLLVMGPQPNKTWGLGNCGTTSVSTQEEIENRITIYPNPSSSMLNIQMAWPAQYDETVELFDAIGKKLMTHNLSRGESLIRFDISGLEAGLYFVKCKEQTGKFVVNK